MPGYPHPEGTRCRGCRGGVSPGRGERGRVAPETEHLALLTMPAALACLCALSIAKADLSRQVA